MNFDNLRVKICKILIFLYLLVYYLYHIHCYSIFLFLYSKRVSRTIRYIEAYILNISVFIKNRILYMSTLTINNFCNTYYFKLM